MATAKELIPQVKHYVAAKQQDARKATPNEILTALEALESRYHRHDVDHATAKILAHEWVDDLSGMTVCQLRKACKAWRMSDAAFAPRSAGQLLPLAGNSGEVEVRAGKQLLEFLTQTEPLEIYTPEQLEMIAAREDVERAARNAEREDAQKQASEEKRQARIQGLEEAIEGAKSALEYEEVKPESDLYPYLKSRLRNYEKELAGLHEQSA